MAIQQTTTINIKEKKAQKIVSYKGKLNLNIIQNCAEATQLDNKINHLEKYKNDVNSLKEDYKEFKKIVN